MDEEEEIKPKKILSEAQKQQLANARAKAIEMRKIRAEERRKERDPSPEREPSPPPPEREPSPPPPEREPSPPPPEREPSPEPEVVKEEEPQFKWVNGRLMFFE